MILTAEDIALIKTYTNSVLQASWSDDRTCNEALETLPAVMILLGRGDRTALRIMEDRLAAYEAGAETYLPGNDPGTA